MKLSFLFFGNQPNKKWLLVRQIAMHLNDRPVQTLQGIGRIFINAGATLRALSLSDSPAQGLTFCQGTYTTMGKDIPALIREWKDRIRFIHLREVVGTPQNFCETFHNNVLTNRVVAFRVYHTAGLTSPIRSDYVLKMARESGREYGYGMKGNLFSICYMKGIINHTL